MNLREAAGGDPNLFRAEKYQKKLQNKIIARNAKRHRANQIADKPRNVFNFINDSLSGITSHKLSYKCTYEINFELIEIFFQQVLHPNKPIIHLKLMKVH